jgi:hypothetical protein
MRNLNLCNEKIYSGKNTALKHDAAKIIQIHQLAFHEDKSHEEKENEDAIKLYKDFLLKVRELIDFLAIGKTDLEKALVVEYLLHHGTFTNKNLLVGKHLEYNEGINVFENTPNAFNVSRLYYDLFRDLYDYPIIYPCYKSNKENSLKIRYAKDNYAINLCQHDGILYGLDLLKGDIYTFKDEFTLEIISSYLKSYLRYKPYLIMLTNLNCSINDIKQYFNLFKNNVSELPLSLEEYDTIRNRIYGMMEEKDSLVKDFNHNTQPMKDDIHKMLSKTR